LVAMSIGEVTGNAADAGFSAAVPYSVAEVAHAGERHGNASFIRGINHFLVTHRAAGLDHRADADGSGIIDAITEREEGIGGHDRALDLQAGMLGLDGGDAGGIHPAHLTRANTDGLAIAGVDNGVGFDELGHLPGKDQVMDFLFGRRALGHYLEIGFGDHAGIPALHQQPAIDALVVQVLDPFGRPLTAFEQPHVGLGGDYLAGLGADAGSNNDLDKLALDDGLGRLGIQFTVEGDNAAEGRFAVGGKGQLVGLADAAVGFRYHGHTAGVG